jgi:hypothetical protein
MWTDEIVEDVRKAREEYAAKFNYNLEEIYEDVKQQQMQSGRKIVSLPPREPETIPQET